MSLEWLKFAWEMAVTLISLAAFFVSWFGRRDKVQQEAVKQVASDLAQKVEDENEHYTALRHEISDMQARMGIVEENIKHLPTAGDLRSLQSAISQLSNGIGKLEGAQQGLTRQVDLMNSYLMRTERV